MSFIVVLFIWWFELNVIVLFVEFWQTSKCRKRYEFNDMCIHSWQNYLKKFSALKIFASKIDVWSLFDFVRSLVRFMITWRSCRKSFLLLLLFRLYLSFKIFHWAYNKSMRRSDVRLLLLIFKCLTIKTAPIFVIIEKSILRHWRFSDIDF